MVCRPASSEIATKGMPRQMLAAISDQRAGQGVPRKSMLVVAHAQHVDQEIGDDRELRVVDPPEGDGRQHRRHDPRQQDDRAQQALERQVVVEQQRQPEAEAEFPDRGDRRCRTRCRTPRSRRRVAQQVLEVLEADEHAAAADRGVGEGEPDAEAERIGQEHHQQADRRQQADDDQEGLPVEQARQPSGLSATACREPVSSGRSSYRRQARCRGHSRTATAARRGMSSRARAVAEFSSAEVALRAALGFGGRGLRCRLPRSRRRRTSAP